MRCFSYVHPSEGIFVRFVVIECRGHNYIRIHKEDCVHVREPGTSTKSSLWHGYFDTFYDAKEFARSLGERVKECTFCSPRNY